MVTKKRLFLKNGYKKKTSKMGDAKMELYELNRKITNDGEIVKENMYKLYNPFKKGKGYNFKYKSSKIVSYLELPLPSELNYADVGRLYRLATNIYSDSNLIAYRAGNKIKPYSREQIRDMLNLKSKTQFYNFWNKIVKYSILKEITLDDLKYWCFNPIYFNSTRYLPLYLFLAFQSDIVKQVPNWVVSEYLSMQEEVISSNGT